MKIFDSVFQNVTCQAIWSACGPCASDDICPLPERCDSCSCWASRIQVCLFHCHSALSFEVIWNYCCLQCHCKHLQSIREAEEQVANLIVHDPQSLFKTKLWGTQIRQNSEWSQDSTWMLPLALHCSPPSQLCCVCCAWYVLVFILCFSGISCLLPNLCHVHVHFFAGHGSSAVSAMWQGIQF